MVCRAPNRLTTCSGTVTGQQLQYDAERRLSHWQSSPSSPTSSADYLYDGSGNRVEQADTSGSTFTKVYYLLGGLEEVSTSGSTSTLTKYYSAGGMLIGENVGGTISYLASDGLGSVSEALSTSGTVTAAQLYGPYGAVRYTSGTMPTAKGFTGQRADASTSGLDYYGARYYDPTLGQFASADTKEGPNRFAYVAGNPETLTDPTGHRICATCDGGGGGDGNPPSNPPSNPPGGKGGGGGCLQKCLDKGRMWLDVLSGLITLIRGGSLWDDLKDLLKQVPNLIADISVVIGGDIMALIPLVTALAHVVRDATDVVAGINNVLSPVGGLPGIGQFTNILRGFSAFLDFATPLLDIVGQFAGAWFNPLGALESKLASYWMPVLERGIAGWATGDIVGYLVRTVGGDALGTIYNGMANGIEAVVTPQEFCSVAQPLCH